MSSINDNNNIETLLSNNKIPIINLGITNLKDQSTQLNIQRIASQLDDALTNSGIAFFINHGLSEEKLDNISKIFEKFCALDDDVKNRYKRKGNHDNHGYVKPGQERFDKNFKEIRHSFNVGNLNKDNYPNELPEFHDVILDLIEDYNALQTIVLQALSIALGKPIDFFEKNHEKLSVDSMNGTTYRLLYYPPVPKPLTKPEDDNKTLEPITRCGAHCDYGTFTILSQNSEGGLEVQLPGTVEWKRIGHFPGALILNGGEMLSIWSDYKYSAIQHRVIIPEDGNKRNYGRHSRALFCHASNDTIVVPLNKQANMIPDELLTAGELLNRKFKQTY